MNTYERRDLILTGINLFLTFLAVVAALIFGYEQILINQKLVNADYEPSLAISFSPPPAGQALINGFQIKNNGKSNVTFYLATLGATSTPAGDFIIDASSWNIISPNSSDLLTGLGEGLPPNGQGSVRAFLDTLETTQNGSTTLPINVYFETGDGQKYIMKTWISVTNIGGKSQLYYGPINYEKINWREK